MPFNSANPSTTPQKSATSTLTPRNTLRQSLRSTSRFFLRRSSPSKSNLTLPPITISPPHHPTAPLSPLTPGYRSSDADTQRVLQKGSTARAKRRKLVKRRFQREGRASAAGFGVLAGDFGGESEDEEVEERDGAGDGERGVWSAPPRLKTPRLPELDFGFERREEEGKMEVGEEVPRLYYRCDIHATSGADFRAAMAECKQIVLESHGRLLHDFEYLSGFLYSLPITVRNLLSSRDPTEQGGYIIITTWDPFQPPKFDPLRMNPFGGQGDISPTKPKVFAEIAKELHFGNPRSRLQRLSRAQSMAQLMQDAKSWRKAESVLGLGRSGSMEVLRSGRVSYHPRAGATLAELMDEDELSEEGDGEDVDDEDFAEEWESVMSGNDESVDGGVAL
nr:hypothetical protein B0A51_00490 [Rachicladosporium sp. CCFEE 5018]